MRDDGKKTMWITKSRAKMQWISVKCTYAEWKVGKMYSTLLIFFKQVAEWESQLCSFFRHNKKNEKEDKKTTEI